MSGRLLSSRRRNLRSQWELLEARRLLSGGHGIKQDDGGVKNSRDDTPSIVVPVGPQTTGDVTSTVGGITVVGPVIPTFEFTSGSGDGVVTPTDDQSDPVGDQSVPPTDSTGGNDDSQD